MQVSTRANSSRSARRRPPAQLRAPRARARGAVRPAWPEWRSSPRPPARRPCSAPGRRGWPHRSGYPPESRTTAGPRGTDHLALVGNPVTLQHRPITSIASPIALAGLDLRDTQRLDSRPARPQQQHRPPAAHVVDAGYGYRRHDRVAGVRVRHERPRRIRCAGPPASAPRTCRGRTTRWRTRTGRSRATHTTAYSIRRAGRSSWSTPMPSLMVTSSSGDRDARKRRQPRMVLCERGNRRATSSATGVAPRDPRSQEVGALSYLKHLECLLRADLPARASPSCCPACTADLASNLFCVYDYEAIARA